MISNLLQATLHDPEVFDELSADGVTPRSHWSGFLDSLSALGAAELERRLARAQRRIRENGVTYNVYGDPQGVSRPWKIDLVPLLIRADEWRHIEQGLIQRAEVLNLLLEDIYGEQKLLASGRLPAALVYGNPAFLRPLVGLQKVKHSHLHLLAVDLARSPDGQWWVLSDRTQAPSGTGYALENRTIVSDILPDLFRTNNVQRLAPFFRAERDTLMALAQHRGPRVVLLTPGPYNETYFEHAYLARYLGFTLVEGADLTVRDRKVYVKTITDLEQVDVILRRVDDSFCDPLELRGDSVLGVPGLVDAIAAGTVKVVNSLGSGTIETAAIMPFLPGLSEHLLGETLKLPSVATWWCGEEYALDWVVKNLDQVVIKPAFPSRPMEPVFGVGLAKEAKQRLAGLLEKHPMEYVAQEQVALSTAPVWDGGGLLPRSVVLRTYVLNSMNGWMVMPGGLVRASGSEGPVVSMQRGGHSKDAWVLWDAPVETFSMLRPRSEPVELRRSPIDLPSRAADNLFWLGRYAERAENMARLLRTLIGRVRKADFAEMGCLLRLHHCFESRLSKLPKKRIAEPAELEAEIISLMTDTERADSLASTLDEVHRVGNSVRERLSADMTRLIGQLNDSANVQEYMLFVEYGAVLTGCLELLSAFSGMERENITRGPGWLFMSLGRRLERAIYALRQVREILKPLKEDEWTLLEFMLEVADSSMTYRSRYFTTLQPVAVLDVLMADETNPRSLDFQLSHLVDLYKKLPRHVPEDLQMVERALRLLRGFALKDIRYPLPGAPEGASVSAERTRLERTLKELAGMLPGWSNNLSNNYFSHARGLPITIGG